MIWNMELEGFNSAKCSYATLKFAYDILSGINHSLYGFECAIGTQLLIMGLRRQSEKELGIWDNFCSYLQMVSLRHLCQNTNGFNIKTFTIDS